MAKSLQIKKATPFKMQLFNLINQMKVTGQEQPKPQKL